MAGQIPIVLTVSAFATLLATSVVRSFIHRRRERVHGIGGTQDIAMWGLLVAWVFLIAAIVTGVIWLSQHSKPNHPASGNAAAASGLAFGCHWRGVPEPACWT